MWCFVRSHALDTVQNVKIVVQKKSPVQTTVNKPAWKSESWEKKT